MKMNMKSLLGCTALLAVASTTSFAGVSCDELKTKIDDGLKAKGVANYSLTVIGKADTADGKVVGTCEGGSKQIVYKRDEGTVKPASETKPAADAKKPAATK